MASLPSATSLMVWLGASDLSASLLGLSVRAFALMFGRSLVLSLVPFRRSLRLILNCLFFECAVLSLVFGLMPELIEL